MHPIPHWQRQELEQWHLTAGTYQDLAKKISDAGNSIATIDAIMYKRLELIEYESDLFNDLTCADGIATYKGMIKLALNTKYLRNLENKVQKDGAILLNEDEFNSIKGRTFTRDYANSMLLPDKYELTANSFWLHVSRYQPNLLRNYFEAASKKSKGNTMRIILPDDSDVPMLYALKLGKLETGSFLSVQYLDENTLIPSTRMS